MFVTALSVRHVSSVLLPGVMLLERGFVRTVHITRTAVELADPFLAYSTLVFLGVGGDVLVAGGGLHVDHPKLRDNVLASRSYTH